MRYDDTVIAKLSASQRPRASYLVKSKRSDRVGGQLHCVEQSDLDETVRLCATRGPVLIALHLQRRKEDALRDIQWFVYVCTSEREMLGWNRHFCVCASEQRNEECWNISVRIFWENVHTVETIQCMKSVL